ncbi:TonB-dependent Receptor Plug Domain [Hymenobacter daecheongensis DSM 21074]|uniref:TonB-dependent Receptor Plug Domain n=1 Tax=Hymenobacter daecheongensis DSM 21074 TaxID=1121955 RepID=A0A1M6IXM5_9BACT|nr:TonB-dependent receptor [Hymenobacter daecheongensis]SHJ39200.1 TonB-dependent Receptor Plug Domain [Hymenobacter daecheongensis DSM 21074]
MKALFLSAALLSATLAHAQTPLRGLITDKNGQAIPGANVYLKGNFEGTSTDSVGRFVLRTKLTGAHTLVVSSVGYASQERVLRLGADTTLLRMALPEAANVLGGVTISAGLFEAGDEKRMTALKPLDIVTTAGGGADITSVLQNLPGTARVGEQEGLFVRGGAASETNTLIDGMIVQNPFYSSIPDVAQRGRFEPSMFKGTAFSTGGYSAQYGQALSSVLLLDTQDKENDANKLTFDANPANLALGYTHRGSITGRVSYTNMQPYFTLLNQTRSWAKAPEGLDASLTVKEKLSTHGSLKLYATTSHSNSTINLPTYERPEEIYPLRLRNRNYFTTNSYQHQFGEGKWELKAGFSYSHNYDYINVAANKSLDRYDRRLQYRTVLTRFLRGNHTLLAGAEVHQIQLTNELISAKYTLQDSYRAAFAEGEFHLGLRVAARVGVRAEQATVLGRANAAPRVSVAYQVGAHGQVSVAAGQFYQTPDKSYIYRNQQLNFEKAGHFMLNYQFMHNDRTFRAETYYKQYAQLVREKGLIGFDPDPYRLVTAATDNSGHGYARGLDLFFRDQKSIKHGDFWVSYSLLDTKRLAGNFVALATPTYASKHNLSVVYKHFVPKLGVSASGTYRFASGRTYYAYEAPEFLGDQLRAYSNLSLSLSKVVFVKRSYVVVYTSLDNALGTRNVYGYRYSPDGKLRYPVQPQTYRTVFAGISLNLSK